MIHLYELIKITLLSFLCWSSLDNRGVSLRVLETVDQIKAITKTNYELMMKEDMDIDSFISERLGK